MFESKSDETVHPGMEGLPYPGGQTRRNTKLIPTRYSQPLNGPAEGSTQPHSQPAPVFSPYGGAKANSFCTAG